MNGGERVVRRGAVAGAWVLSALLSVSMFLPSSLIHNYPLLLLSGSVCSVGEIHISRNDQILSREYKVVSL